MKWTTTQVYNNIKKVFPASKGFHFWQPVTEPRTKPSKQKIEKMLCAVHNKHNLHIETVHYFEDLTLCVYRLEKKKKIAQLTTNNF